MSIDAAGEKGSRRPTQLVLLVGSNPVPNYLTACALRPRRVVLVYTEETKDAKDRLRRELARALQLSEDAFLEPFVKDATCATTVRRIVDPLLQHEDQDVLLNYTGGTKVMAAHARLVFYEANGKREHASYLDEGGKDRSGKGASAAAALRRREREASLRVPRDPVDARDRARASRHHAQATGCEDPGSHNRRRAGDLVQGAGGSAARGRAVL